MIKYRSGYKYQLVDNCITKTAVIGYSITTEYICLDTEGNLQIKKGYAWDGCSGPTWDDKTNMHGGLVHDALYQLMREGYLPTQCRRLVDKELYNLCIMDGMSKIRAWIYYKAVRLFGYSSARIQSENIKIIN